MRQIVYLPLLLILLAAAGCHRAQSAGANQDNALMPCPAVQTTAGDFERVVVVRLKNGTDVLQGLKRTLLVP